MKTLQKLIIIYFIFPFACSSDVSIMKHPGGSLGDETAVDSLQEDTNNNEEENNEPSLEPSDETTEMSELTIGFAEIHFRQIACPACVGESSEFDISASLKLHQPTSGNYMESLTPVGTCTTNIYNTHVSSQPLESTQLAYFNNISLNPSGTGNWSNNNIYEYQYQRNTPHSVSTEHGTIENAFVTVEGFDTIEPYTLLWVDPTYAFDAPIYRSGAMFSWSPSVANSQFEIIIAVYSYDGTQFLGSVSCMEIDVGYMQIPSSYLQQYPAGSLVAVHFFRHRIDKVPAESFNGWFESHMIWEVVGTGHIQ